MSPEAAPPSDAPARFCHLCGRGLANGGRHFRHPAWPPDVHLRVCDVCAAGKPRCPICRLPGNAAGVCSTCRESGSACVACGRKLRRAAAGADGRDGLYCANCLRGPQCDSCGLPAGEGKPGADGRRICAVCRASAIDRPEEAALVFRAAEELIHEQLGLSLNVPTGLTLVGREELGAILADMGEDAASVGDTLGVYTRRGRRRGIYALAGLPRLLLLQVAAHEWAHAWQMESAPLLRDPVLREGFAEWVAYRVLSALGERDAAGRILGRQDSYGEGLRYLLGVEQQVGPRGVIEWCRRAR